MRKSWRDYVSKLNHKTPTNKVWDMVRKITGKKVFPSIKQLKKDGNNITEVNEIANVLANNIVKNSSTENYSEKFKRHKIKAEHTALISIQITWKTTMHHLKWENWWTP